MPEPLTDKERYMALLQGCGEVYLSAQAARNIHAWILSLSAENEQVRKDILELMDTNVAQSAENGVLTAALQTIYMQSDDPVIKKIASVSTRHADD